LLQGILSNLISNAIKYTRQGRVDVRVIDKGAQLQIEVIDTGQGISADKLELIFKEFVRLDASDSGTEGLGLGLSIVRRYASLMSHALHVQSVPGQGSIFTVTMARAQTPERVVESLASAPTELADDHGLAGLNVLVIDNVELLLVSMSKTLSGWGCEVRSARNMAEAVQSAYQQWPDLVVSDHHLGDREPNGLELIKGLREQGAREGRKRLPALLMTGDVSPQLEAQAREAGVRIVTGDTKVVPRGKADKLFINTSGVGVIPAGLNLSARSLQVGDVLLTNGTLGDHGAAILIARGELKLESKVASDSAPLHGLIQALLQAVPVRAMRDLTRGGLAATVNEWAHSANLGLHIDELSVPVRSEVQGVCELLGLDPLHLANEGKLLAAVPKAHAPAALDALRGHPLGVNAAVVGEVIAAHPGVVTIATGFGTDRVLDMLVGEPLPRIC
jgi:CheY-like chemotaxis protein/anti-sigma regulatory factor (Ser/Thr protein kinase)